MRQETLDFDPELVQRLMRGGEPAPESNRPLLRAMRRAWAAELTPIQRRYLHDYYAETLTMQKIAARYGVNVATVSRTLRRARERLRRVLRYYVE